jgi:glutathione S-transferase
MATLYHYHDCPYCFRVRAYCAERGIAYTSNTCDRDQPPPELPSLNPLQRLPIWVTDKGKPVFGSTTIVLYLEAGDATGTRLLPDDPLARARCLMAEELATHGLLEPLIRLDREIGGRPADAWNLQTYRGEAARIRKMLTIFEQLLGGREWLVGDALSFADLCLVQPLTILERFGLDLQGLPGLASLAERISKRPSIQSARRPSPATQVVAAP